MKHAPGGAQQIDYHKACRDALRAAFRTKALPANVAFTDLTDVFDEVPESDTVFLDAFHLGDRGNSIVGEAIGRSLFSGSDAGS